MKLYLQMQAKLRRMSYAKQDGSEPELRNGRDRGFLGERRPLACSCRQLAGNLWRNVFTRNGKHLGKLPRCSASATRCC
jgi:hypothetical protein